jgi:hypothetical protein
MRVPSPEKLILSSGISPVKMSQIPNKSMLKFLDSFIGRLLSENELSALIKISTIPTRHQRPSSDNPG